MSSEQKAAAPPPPPAPPTQQPPLPLPKDSSGIEFGIFLLAPRKERIEQLCAACAECFIPVLRAEIGEEITAAHYDKFCSDASAERIEFRVVGAFEATTSFRNKHRLEVLVSQEAESVADFGKRLCDVLLRPRAKPPKQSWFNWVPVGTGRLALWRRPKVKDRFVGMKRSGVTHLVSVMGPNELGSAGMKKFGEFTAKHGIAWIHIRLGRAKLGLISAPGENRKIVNSLVQLHDILHDPNSQHSMLLHCAAGLHRTGLYGYSLLRLDGRSPVQALMSMLVCRAATALGVNVPYRRTDFADERVVPRVQALLALPAGSVRQESENRHGGGKRGRHVSEVHDGGKRGRHVSEVHGGGKRGRHVSEVTEKLASLSVDD